MELLKRVLTYEPIMSTAFATAIVVQVDKTLRDFNVYELTAQQISTVNGWLPILAVLTGFLVRHAVTPTAKLPATPQEG